MGRISEAVKRSALLTNADLPDLGQNTKRMKAALLFRRYQYHPKALVHDEDEFLYTTEASQSEDEFISLEEAREIVLNACQATEDLIDLASPVEAESDSTPESKVSHL